MTRAPGTNRAALPITDIRPAVDIGEYAAVSGSAFDPED
jgi:hypothetical protein